MEDDDEYLYGEASEPSAKRLKEDNKEVMDAEAVESGSESDSDSDVEFVINTDGPKVSAPQQVTQAISVKDEKDKEKEKGEVKEEGVEIKEEGDDEEIKKEKTEAGTIDINAVAEHDGKPITEISLESFANKPWRQPGADVSDYFNYSFDEFTWSAYVNKQDQLRDLYSPDKVMQNMMGGMPGMPGMPPMDMSQMFGGMPPMNNNSNQQGNGQQPQMDMNQMNQMMMGMGMMPPGFMPQQGQGQGSQNQNRRK